MTFPMPFFCPANDRGPAALLDLTGKTYFGDMTAQAGNAAAFDGSTGSQPVAACASKVSATSAYVGIDLGDSLSICPASVTLQSSNTSGFAGSSIVQLRWDCYGSSTLPANATNGTLLGSTLAIVDGGGATAALTVTGNMAWRYLWFTAVLIAGSADDWMLAEAEVTGWVQ